MRSVAHVNVIGAANTDSSGAYLFLQCLRDISKKTNNGTDLIGEWSQSVTSLLLNKLPTMTTLLKTMGLTFATA